MILILPFWFIQHRTALLHARTTASRLVSRAFAGWRVARGRAVAVQRWLERRIERHVRTAMTQWRHRLLQR